MFENRVLRCFVLKKDEMVEGRLDKIACCEAS
jgi:hypothetical protein